MPVSRRGDLHLHTAGLAEFDGLWQRLYVGLTPPAWCCYKPLLKEIGFVVVAWEYMSCGMVRAAYVAALSVHECSCHGFWVRSLELMVEHLRPCRGSSQIWAIPIDPLQWSAVPSSLQCKVPCAMGSSAYHFDNDQSASSFLNASPARPH